MEAGAMTAVLFEVSSIFRNLFLCVISGLMISVVLNELCRNLYTPGRGKTLNRFSLVVEEHPHCLVVFGAFKTPPLKPA